MPFMSFQDSAADDEFDFDSPASVATLVGEHVTVRKRRRLDDGSSSSTTTAISTPASAQVQGLQGSAIWDQCVTKLGRKDKYDALGTMVAIRGREVGEASGRIFRQLQRHILDALEEAEEKVSDLQFGNIQLTNTSVVYATTSAGQDQVITQQSSHSSITSQHTTTEYLDEPIEGTEQQEDTEDLFT